MTRSFGLPSYTGNAGKSLKVNSTSDWLTWSVEWTDVYTTSTDPAANVATSTAKIDAFDGVVITLTGAGNAQTLQSPTVTTAWKLFTVVNNDTSTNTIVVNGTTLAIGASLSFVWDATAWTTISPVTASQVANVPAGGISQTNVQTALNGLDTVKAPLATPTFTTNITTPVILGGTGTTQTLTYQTTSWVGAAGADHIFKVWNNGATEAARILNSGNYGVWVAAPTATLHLKAGTAAASSAPFKLNSGTVNTTAEAGAMEYDWTNIFFSPSTTRMTLFAGTAGASAPNTNNIGVLLDYYGTSSTRALTTPNSWASVVVWWVTYKIPLYS